MSCTCRLVEIDEAAELRLEQAESAELFAVCPIPSPDSAWTYCEPVTDSSRYFVIRVEDPATKRHAFLGMGFEERSHATAFCAALSDYVSRASRMKEAAQASTLRSNVPSAGAEAALAGRVDHHSCQHGDGLPGAMRSLPALADFSLKEGEKIHVTLGSKSLGNRTGPGLRKEAPLGNMAVPMPGGPAAVASSAPLPPPEADQGSAGGWATF